MKAIISFFLAAVLLGSSLFAKQIELNAEDKAILFSSPDSVNTMVLSNEEMSETKGQFWFIVIPFAIGLLIAGACGYTGKCSASSNIEGKYSF